MTLIVGVACIAFGVGVWVGAWIAGGLGST